MKRVRIERIERLTAEAAAILEEYYASLEVVVRATAEETDRIISAPGAGMWLAYAQGSAEEASGTGELAADLDSLQEKLAGCVILRGMEQFVGAAECKRLYVRPGFRGQRIADQLLDAMEEFAREKGYEWVYLDTHHGLQTAIALYHRRGYEGCARYNENPQATVFLRKRLG